LLLRFLGLCRSFGTSVETPETLDSCDAAAEGAGLDTADGTAESAADEAAESDTAGEDCAASLISNPSKTTKKYK